MTPSDIEKAAALLERRRKLIYVHEELADPDNKSTVVISRIDPNGPMYPSVVHYFQDAAEFSVVMNALVARADTELDALGVPREGR